MWRKCNYNPFQVYGYCWQCGFILCVHLLQWSGHRHAHQLDFHRPAPVSGWCHGLGHDCPGHSGHWIRCVSILRQLLDILFNIQTKDCLYMFFCFFPNLSRYFPLLHGVCQSKGPAWFWYYHPWPGPADRLCCVPADQTNLAGVQYGPTYFLSSILVVRSGGVACVWCVSFAVSQWSFWPLWRSSSSCSSSSLGKDFWLPSLWSKRPASGSYDM